MNDTEMTKAYELRDLRADDVFPMFRIISKIGVKEFKDCFSSDAIKKMGGKNANAETVGMAVFFEIASLIIEHLPDCKDDLYMFLSNLSGLGKDEIADLPMATFIEMIVDVIKKPEFKDFFQVVSKLFK